MTDPKNTGEQIAQLIIEAGRHPNIALAHLGAVLASRGVVTVADLERAVAEVKVWEDETNPAER